MTRQWTGRIAAADLDCAGAAVVVTAIVAPHMVRKRKKVAILVTI